MGRHNHRRKMPAQREIPNSGAESLIDLADLGVENLAFSSGSVMGVAFLAALKKFNLKGIKRVAGVSIGALMALCLAIGYKYEEIEAKVEEVYKKGLSYMMELSVWDTHKVVGNFIKSACSRNGYVYLSKGERLRNFIKELIVEKLGEGAENITFGELERSQDVNRTDASPLPKLYTHAVDLRKHENIVHSAETTPDMKVLDAVLASMSIPGLFKPLGDIADAGVTRNLPGDTFNKVKYFPDSRRAALRAAGLEDETGCENPHTLSLYLRPSETTSKWTPSLFNTVGSVVGTAMIAPTKEKFDADRVIDINCAPYHYFSTGIKPSDMDRLTKVSSDATDTWHERARARRSAHCSRAATVA